MMALMKMGRLAVPDGLSNNAEYVRQDNTQPTTQPLTNVTIQTFTHTSNQGYKYKCSFSKRMKKVRLVTS